MKPFLLSTCISAAVLAGSTAYGQIMINDCGAQGDVATTVEVYPDHVLVVHEMGMDSGNSRQEIRLDQQVSGSGSVYRGEGYEFVSHGGTEQLIPEGQEPMTCARVAINTGEGEATPDAAGGPIVVNQPAMSLGGHVRSGPGMAHMTLGSTQEGAPITVLENSGVVMQGYPWFFIREANGDRGFQWGGIICDPAGQIDGVFAQCP